MFISLAAPITIIFSLPILSVWVVRTHYQISYHVYFQPLKTKAFLDNNILYDGIFCVEGVNQVTVTSKRLDNYCTEQKTFLSQNQLFKRILDAKMIELLEGNDGLPFLLLRFLALRSLES